MGRTPYVDWGARRREIRALLEQGLTQAEAGARLGLSPNTVSHCMRTDLVFSRTKLQQVRLSDLPLKTRLSGARRAIDDYVDPDAPDAREQAEELMLTALFPSSRVYWVGAGSRAGDLAKAA